MKTRFGIITLLLLACSFLMPTEVEASHIMGYDVNYQCINNCTIRVEQRAYRDCTGSSIISPTPFQFVPQTTGCGLPTPLGPWSAQQVQEVTPICGTIQTQCSQSGATINGVEEYYWWRDYDICGLGNCIFTLEWTTCCRNPAITNTNSSSIWVGATTLNTGLSQCNNSPSFTNPPVPYICQGQPYTFNQGAVDAEGDSLAYSLGTCYNNNGNSPIVYNAGYSAAQPLGPTWNVSINPITGDITVTPNPTGNIVVGVLCVYVEEWRNGQLINTIARDIQMTVIPCPGNTLPSSNGVANLSGGVQNSAWDITVCAGTPLSFDIPTIDPDAGQTQTLFWNSLIFPGTGATFGAGVQNDTITGNQPTGTFTWTPQTTGVYVVTFTVMDDACPITGQNQYSVTINVQGGLPNAGITATPTGCTNVSLNANPGTGGTGPYIYQWYGDGNLDVNPNNTNQTLSHTYPAPGTYIANVLITDNFGCQSVLIDTVIIPTGPTADAGPDISICSGYPIQLGSQDIPTQSYNWFPTTGLSDPSISDPVFNYVNTTGSPVTLSFTVSATEGFCTSFDYVDVTVFPTPTANITGTNQICVGGQTTLTATGGTSYLWSTGATTQSITVNPTTTTTYTVTAINNGCASQPLPYTVTVTPGPTAFITGVDSVCPGSAATLTVAGGTTWQWSTGSTNQTITLTNLNQDSTVTVVPFDQGCPGAPVSYTVSQHEKPVGDFFFTTACINDPTIFTDQSTISNGSVIAWRWDFDDPNTGTANISNTQNPTHTFSDAGTYNVQVIITSSNGCQDTAVRAVTVNPLPVPDFDFQNVCDGFEANFTDQSSSAAGISSWSWNFAGQGTSTQQNPSFQFSGSGAFNVILTVTDGNGCVNSREKTILIHPNPTPEFSWELRCFNSIADFTSSSFLNDPLGTTLDMHTWDFGDPASGPDNTSNDMNPTHTWSSPGTYNVTLTVTSSQGCETSLTRPVIVPSIPPLQVQNDTVCSGFGGTLLVTGGVQPNTTVEWFFSPNSTHPFHYGNIFAAPPATVTTTYYVAMEDAEGCLSPLQPVHLIINAAPSAQWAFSNTEVEIPNAIVEFNILQQLQGPIVSWAWDFGDGNTSNQVEPVHQYTEEGEFDVSLTIIDDFGCITAYTLPNAIHVSKHVAIYVPNAFTPNGDGLNDEFFVVPRLVTDLTIDVYDRWGKLIFKSDNPNFRWGGVDSDGQPLPEGVYTWVINAVEFSGERIKKAGTVTIYR